MPSFTADIEGDYVLQLQGKLIFPDRAYPEADTSTADLKLKAASGNGVAACGAAPTDAALVLAAGLLLSRLRRRRS